MPQPLIARVKNGRLVLDEPTDLPEGAELHLVPEDDGDTLDDAERAALHRSLERGNIASRAGRGIDEGALRAKLRARRS